MTAWPSVEALAAEVGFDLPRRYNASRLLWDNLEARADRLAILSDEGAWTYRALAEEAGRVGNALLALGARPGDRALLLMEDAPAYPAAVMGALRAGLVPVLLNTLSPAELVRFFAEDSAATTAVVSAAFRELVGEPALGRRLPTLVEGGAPLPGQTAWSAVREAPVALDEAPTRRGDMAFWMYSSGSTGRPKGVVHRHEDAAYTAATYGAKVLGLRPDDICFSVPKLYFAYGFGNAVTFPMSVGAAAVLMRGRPEPAAVFEQIARHRPTILFGLPTLYTALARHPEAGRADLASLRLSISAAEVLSAEVAKAWGELTGLEVVEGLGSTEMLHIYLSNRPGRTKGASAGQVVPGYAVRLVDPDGREVGDGEEGLMEVRGLSGAREYWNRPDKTAETMRDGWLVTGDRFVRDAEGFHFFRGRADDLVKVSGQWVWPLEIELALNEHPEVHEACVQAMTLPDGRTTLKAWIAPARGVEPGAGLADRLKAHAKAALLPHKYPREIVFLDALPKTGTDKIDRQALRRLGEPDGATPRPSEGAAP